MSRQTSKRFDAVHHTLSDILDLSEDRDHYETLKELAKRIDPIIVLESEIKRDVPKWYLNLILALTELYDKGYADSIDDTKKLK